MIKTAVLESLSRERQRELGQFFTPNYVASLMADMFSLDCEDIRLLDAGAGKGALSKALIGRLCNLDCKPKSITVTAYEIDETLLPDLKETLQLCEYQCVQHGINFKKYIYNEDFISAAVSALANNHSSSTTHFNAAIVNPPYRKIHSSSKERLLLRSVGIETSNLYSSFVSLIIKLLLPRAELVAITPRSFCNGPYFKSFREELLTKTSLEKLHIFDSRKAAFKHEDVLQENVIIHAKKGEKQSRSVAISKSNGRKDGGVIRKKISYDEVVCKNDPQKFIHFVVEKEQFKVRSLMADLPEALDRLNVKVSTGRVVDFRAKELIKQNPTKSTFPLIYPGHIDGGLISWPKENSRKPNAILNSEKAKELFVPSGYYVLVKRFSSKEESKRIVAALFRPQDVPAKFIAFENHLNFFHKNGAGLSRQIAMGLTAFLNSSIVDSYFRLFNGHTQVNANDLRSLKYPSENCLRTLGSKVKSHHFRDLDELDNLVNAHIFYEKQKA